MPPGKSNTPRLRLRLSTAAESAVRNGHPWVFADSIRDQNRLGQPGELAVVYDKNDRFLAVGLFDPDSPIRIRILHKGKPQEIDRQWWTARLEEALERRQGLFDQQTTGFRWLNGESDGWPGLVLDRYAQNLVLKLYTASWVPIFDEITELITARLQPERLVLRLSRNIQFHRVPASAGCLPSPMSNPSTSVLPLLGERAGVRGTGACEYPDHSMRKQTSFADGQVLVGPPFDGSVTFLESGLRFEADLLRGQKTGFFLDQRENRRKVEMLAKGRHVLNAFSFSGGFSLYAARGGARSVTDLDISSHALDAADRNFDLNQNDGTIRACKHEKVKADTFEWLEQTSGKKFDLIILDPPSLARREAERAGAIAAYGKLARLGIKRLQPGGILVSSSCSAHVAAEEFFQVVRTAASKSSRRFCELEATRHPPDHPATFDAAHYLKTIYLTFS